MSHRNALIAPVFLRCSYAICRKNDRAIPHKLCTALPQVLRMQWEQPAQHPPGHTPGARAHIFVLCHTPALASGVPVGSLQRARTAHWAVCTPASTGGLSLLPVADHTGNHSSDHGNQRRTNQDCRNISGNPCQHSHTSRLRIRRYFVF